MRNDHLLGTLKKFKTPVICAVGLCATAIFLFSSASSQKDSSPIVIETAHVSELKPHEHRDGDAVADSGHHVTVESRVFIAPRDIYVSEIGFEMVNAPAVTLHHASLVDLSRPNATCPNLSNWKEIFVYGPDRMYDKKLTFPDGYGVLIKKGTPLKLVLMIHNPEPPLGPGGIYHDVYTRIILTESDKKPSALKLLTPYLMHLDDTDITCWHKREDLSDFYTFTVPANKKSFIYSGQGESDQAATKTFDKPATIFDLAGHLHGWQGGQDLIVRKNGEILHTFHSTRSTTTPYMYEIRHVTIPFHVNANDKLSLSAVYNNPHAVPIRGAMGIVGFYYSED